MHSALWYKVPTVIILLKEHCWMIQTTHQSIRQEKMWFLPSFCLPNAPNDPQIHSALWYKVPTVIMLLIVHCWMIQTTQPSFWQEKTVIWAKFLTAEFPKWPLNAFSIVIQGTYCHNIAYGALLDDPNHPTKFSARENYNFGQYFGCWKPYMTLKCIQQCDTRYLLS